MSSLRRRATSPGLRAPSRRSRRRALYMQPFRCFLALVLSRFGKYFDRITHGVQEDQTLANSHPPSGLVTSREYIDRVIARFLYTIKIWRREQRSSGCDGGKKPKTGQMTTLVSPRAPSSCTRTGSGKTGYVHRGYGNGIASGTLEDASILLGLGGPRRQRTAHDRKSAWAGRTRRRSSTMPAVRFL